MGTPDRQARSLIAIPTMLPWFARVGSICTLPLVISMHLVLKCMSIQHVFRTSNWIQQTRRYKSPEEQSSKRCTPVTRGTPSTKTFFYFQNVTRFHITRVNVISFTPIVSTACTAPIFTVLTAALQHYVQTKSEHRTTNVETAERNLRTPLRMALAASISTNSQLLSTFARTKKSR